jgi:hypothetical protein
MLEQLIARVASLLAARHLSFIRSHTHDLVRGDTHCTTNARLGYCPDDNFSID